MCTPLRFASKHGILSSNGPIHREDRLPGRLPQWRVRPCSLNPNGEGFTLKEWVKSGDLMDCFGRINDISMWIDHVKPMSNLVTMLHHVTTSSLIDEGVTAGHLQV